MIVVRLKGDLGNQMCQYAIGRIIAEKKNYTLKLDETDDGWKNILPDFFPNYKKIIGKEIMYNPIYIGPNLNHLDMEMLFNYDGFIFLHGFWQKYYLYTKYIEKLKEWYTYDDSNYEKPEKDDLVIHVRLFKINEHKIIPPILTFIDIANTLTYKRCFIVTDVPDSPLLLPLLNLKNSIIRSKTRMEDFTFLKHARKLIISQSSFSWWASFLGNADKVYSPLTIDINTPHYWKLNPDKIKDVDLIESGEKFVKFII